MSSRRPRWVPILVVVALAAATIVAVPSAREPVLRAAGWALVVNEPVAPADIIVVSLGSGGAGALEAADLVQSGIATRVAVFAGPPSGEDHEFIRRGLPDEDAGARQIRQLRWLGVTDVLQIPRSDVGTEGEAQLLPPWCDQHRFSQHHLKHDEDWEGPRLLSRRSFLNSTFGAAAASEQAAAQMPAVQPAHRRLILKRPNDILIASQASAIPGSGSRRLADRRSILRSNTCRMHAFLKYRGVVAATDEPISFNKQFCPQAPHPRPRPQ